MALQTILDELNKHVKNHQPTLAIYLDLSKAYDTISHQKLLYKLNNNFNFDEHTTEFLTSYLTNRTQETHTDHAKSKSQTITHGIPQGSTLSTTFFLLYINDIWTTANHSNVYTYADDTTLTITAPDLKNLKKHAQTDLTNFVNYLHDNNLVPNATKTTYTTFYPRDYPDVDLYFNETKLKHDAVTKLLGVFIQNTLKFHQNTTQVIKKLQPHIHTFKYINKILPTLTMKQQYYSFIYPQLIYAITIWGHEKSNKEYLQKLHRTHKKIVRLMLNKPPRTHTQPLMHQYKIMNIFYLYIYRISVEMHPFIHPPEEEINRPQHNHHYLTNPHHNPMRTRLANHPYKQTLYIPNPYSYSKTYQPKHILHLSAAKHSAIWNCLRKDIQEEKNIKTFKRVLACFLLNDQNKNEHDKTKTFR